MMNDKYTDEMRKIRASDELKSKIIMLAHNETAKKRKRSPAWLKAAVFAASFLLVALVINFGIPYIKLPTPAASQKSQTNTQSRVKAGSGNSVSQDTAIPDTDLSRPDSAAIAGKIDSGGADSSRTSGASGGIGAPMQRVYKDFVLTANAASDSGGIQTVLKPDVKIALQQYSPLMSSVPGYPFTVICNWVTATIKISIDQGSIMTWDLQSGKVTDCGKDFTAATGQTFYVSMLQDGTSVSEAILTVKAVVTLTDAEDVKYDSVIGTRKVIIQEDPEHQGMYTAQLLSSGL